MLIAWPTSSITQLSKRTFSMPPPRPRRLFIRTPICVPGAGHVAGHQVANPARGLAADRDRAMRAMHRAAGDRDVLARAVYAQAVAVLPGFDHDAVVAGVDVAVGDAHVAAGVHRDAVGVDAGVGLDGDVAHHHVIGVQQMDGPHRRAGEADAFDQHVVAVHGAHERRTQFRRGCQVGLARSGRVDFEQFQEALPIRPVGAARVAARGFLPRHQLHPLRVVAGQHAAAGDGDIFQMPAADQRDGRERFDTLLPPFREGEPRRGKSHRGAGVDVQRQVAHQFDGAADVIAGGDEYRPAARRFGGLNGRPDGVRGGRRGVVAGAVVEDVEERAGAPRGSGQEDEPGQSLHLGPWHP